jgi:hypothetical protein
MPFTMGANALTTQYATMTDATTITKVIVAVASTCQGYLYAGASDNLTRYARAVSGNIVGYVNSEIMAQFVADLNTDTGSDAAILARVAAIWPFLAYGY